MIEEMLVAEARKSWGAGWQHLSEKQQKAAVCQALVLRLMSSRVTPGSELERFQLLAVKALGLVGAVMPDIKASDRMVELAKDFLHASELGKGNVIFENYSTLQNLGDSLAERVISFFSDSEEKEKPKS